MPDENIDEQTNPVAPSAANLAPAGPSEMPTSGPPDENTVPVTTSGIAACGCGCGGGGKCTCGGGGKAPLVYALGEIGHDFGTEARRDSFIQAGLANPHDASQLAAHLTANPSHASAVIWTLNQETTPIYAIQPAGPFAATSYERLREFLNAQLTEGVERVSIPGFVAGKVSLLNGQVVPIIVPELRGMYSWSTPKLVQAVMGPRPEAGENLLKFERESNDIGNFLERVYYEIRNLGLTPQERAMNYAATNAFQIESVFKSAIETGTKLDSISVERSPICRPASDCWDVKLIFFNPGRRFEQARHVYRFTVDVSDVVPVTVGKVRQWDIY